MHDISSTMSSLPTCGRQSSVKAVKSATSDAFGSKVKGDFSSTQVENVNRIRIYSKNKYGPSK